MAFRGSDAIPGPTVSFKDPDPPDNCLTGVVAAGTNKHDVDLGLTTPVRPQGGPATSWVLKPGME